MKQLRTQGHASLQMLEKALITYVGLLVLSLLGIFIIEPSIYTSSLSPVLVSTERYPWPVILFLIALLAFLSLMLYGVVHHWRWLFWPILVAFAGSIIQIPLEGLQLAGVLVLPEHYPVWYSLFRIGVGIIELGFAIWMFQVWRYCGVWALGKSVGE